MAQVFSAPEGFEAPEVDYRGDWQAQEAEYIQRLADRCKMNGTNPLHGEVIAFPVADGAAQYMVWKTKPLQLLHLNLGDAWHANDILLRGLRLADIKDMVEQEQRMRAFFAKRTEGTA